MPDDEASHEAADRTDDAPAMKFEDLEKRAGRAVRRRSDLEHYAYRLLSVGAVLLLAIGTVTYRILEGWSWIDSFYFSSIAVTTVGFGDLTPSTGGTKLFTVFYVFSGIAIITSFLNVRLKRHARSIAATRQARQPDQRSSEA